MGKALFKGKYSSLSRRMRGWDYTRKGNYFITINTHEKGNVFGELLEGNMLLNKYGKIADTYILTIPDHFPHVKLHAHMVMPDHVHILMEIYKSPEGKAQHRCVSGKKDLITERNDKRCDIHRETQQCCASPSKGKTLPDRKISKTFYSRKPGSISVIIGSYKSKCSKEIHKLYNKNRFNWQASFYDQVIYDEQYLQNTIHYILTNPQNTHKNKTPIFR